MPEANLSLKVLPVVDEKDIYPLVDQVIAMIKDSGLNYVVSPNDTTIEGDLDSLLNLVKKAQLICVAAGAPRVISVVTIDYKPSGVTIDEKIFPYRS
ncbi:MAG TPA: thiamine-binding protein [Syntrophomonas sp.]|nr:thiamine-binding protein [Syntrophomonas sp.]